MKLTVLTELEDRRTGKKKVWKRWEVEGDTLEDCFKAAYPTERGYRYCNDTTIRFENPDTHRKYLEWKRHGVTIEMFYGSATVD